MKELTPELQKAIAALAREIELVNVRTIEFTARLMAPAQPLAQTHLDIDAQAGPGTLEDGFVVEGRFVLRARPKNETREPGDPYFEATYKVGAIYRRAGPLPSADVLSAFAETNGLMHLWPYFRVFVQQACGQLALAPIIVPAFRPVKYVVADTDAKVQPTEERKPRSR